MKKIVLIIILYANISGYATASTNNISEKTDEAVRLTEIKNLRFGMFICWSFSTFSNVEWTRDVKDVTFFNPTGCDTDQWCRVASQAGMKYILFLTKHHDGFCLWDTSTTDWKVTKSPLGIDVLAKLKKSCDKYELKLALYFSEGDWTWPKGKNAEIKKAQLKELLTQYGRIEYIWFDHAQKDGGLNHQQTVEFCKSFQTDCFVGFNSGDQSGADIRLGEWGKPGPLSDVSSRDIVAKRGSNIEKANYRLAEFTYPIFPRNPKARWFYTTPEWDNMCLQPEKIFKDYLGAKQYGNLFALDVGPMRNGKLRHIDVETLLKVGKYIRGEIQLKTEPAHVEKDKLSNVKDVNHGMIKTTGGSFQMGDSKRHGYGDERPVHTVTLDSFYMGKYEVTNGQYCQYLNSTLGQGLITVTSGVVYQAGSGTSYPYCDTSSSNSDSQVTYSNGVFTVRTKGVRNMSNDPMVLVSWYGSVAYCNWRSLQQDKQPCYDVSTWSCDFSRNGYRLPTESEWEYAARGGLSGKRFPWGDTISHSQANYYSSSSYSYDISPTRSYHPTWNDGKHPYNTSVAGSFPANGYGLYDMTGNVWEWCNDWYGSYRSHSKSNPKGPTNGSYRVLRGGGWSSLASISRVTFRVPRSPGTRHSTLGFRLSMNSN
jgi:alpha-L-fucosidase